MVVRAAERIEDLFKVLDTVEKRLEQDLEGINLVVVPGVSGDARISTADQAALEKFHAEYLETLWARDDLSEESKRRIAARYEDIRQEISLSGSVADMDPLKLDDGTSVDFVGICARQISGKDRDLDRDGRLDLIYTTLHEIGHTIHSSHFGGRDCSAEQKELFADSFAAAFMKNEIGIDDAFERIAQYRAGECDPDYTFDIHAKEIEQRMAGYERYGVVSALKSMDAYVQEVQSDQAVEPGRATVVVHDTKPPSLQ